MDSTFLICLQDFYFFIIVHEKAIVTVGFGNIFHD